MLGSVKTNDWASDLYVVGDVDYVVGSGRLQLVDVSDKSNPARIGYYKNSKIHSR